MNVISKRGLLGCAVQHRDALAVLMHWHKVARAAKWSHLAEVRRDFPSADQVGKVLIFDVKGNAYRLVTCVDYAKQRVFVKALMTHAEYDRKGWMKWA